MDELAALDRREIYFSQSFRRTGCTPCDRSEASHQIARIRKEKERLKIHIAELGNGER